LIQRKGNVLIDARKPLGIDSPLESELLERELENGVMIEQAPFVHEDLVNSMLGGLISAEEHVSAHEAHLTDDLAGDVNLIK
jgi:hypothetical protein